MKSFYRVLYYVKLQYKAVLLSIFCAFSVALLFSFSLAAMLPLMKVMMDEEGLHGWTWRNMIKDRSGVSFNAVPLQEYFTESEAQDQVGRGKLQVASVKLNSPGYNKLMEQDEIIAVRIGGIEYRDRMEQLEQLARAPAGQTVELIIERDKGGDQTVDITLEEPLGYRMYAGGAQWFLDRVPQDRGSNFKRNSIIMIIIVMLAASIVRCGLRFGQEYLVKRIGYRTLMYMRIDMYKHVIRLPLSYFSTEGVSDTLSRFIKDSNNLMGGINILLGKAIREPLIVITLAGAAFIINPKMTLVVITWAAR